MARTSAAQKFGKRLRALRKQTGLTQEQLGIATGISQTYISGLESGTRNPSLTTQEKLAEALKVPTAALTDYDGSYKIKDRSRTWRH